MLILFAETFTQNDWSGGQDASGIYSVSTVVDKWGSIQNATDASMTVDTSAGGVQVQAPMPNSLYFYAHFDEAGSDAFKAYNWQGWYLTHNPDAQGGYGGYNPNQSTTVYKYGGGSLYIPGGDRQYLAYDTSSPSQGTLDDFLPLDYGTIEMWVKPVGGAFNDGRSAQFFWSEFNLDGATQRDDVSLDGGTQTFDAYFQHTWKENKYSAPGDTDWVHIAFTWNKDYNSANGNDPNLAVRFYLNGTEQTASTAGADIITGTRSWDNTRPVIAIGGPFPNNASSYSWYIDEVFIWNYEKSASEIAASGASAELVSVILDFNGPANFDSISWVESMGSRHGGANDLKIQIRTAPDNGGVPGTWTSWAGPDGTSSTYYTGGTGTISSIHNGHRFLQYKVIFEAAASCFSKKLESITINYTPLTAVESAVGEIIPTYTKIGTSNNTYTMYIKPTITSDNTGFNRISISFDSSFGTASVGSVSLQDAPYADDPGTYTDLTSGVDYNVTTSAGSIAIDFASKITDDGRRVKIVFTLPSTPSSVGIYSFNVQVDDTTTATAPDTVSAGNAATTGDFYDTDSLAVSVDYTQKAVTSSSAEIDPNYAFLDDGTAVFSIYFYGEVGAGATGYNKLTITFPDNLDFSKLLSLKKGGASFSATISYSNKKLTVILDTKITATNNDVLQITFEAKLLKDGLGKFSMEVDDTDTPEENGPPQEVVEGDSYSGNPFDCLEVRVGYKVVPASLSESVTVVASFNYRVYLTIEPGTFPEDVEVSLSKVKTDGREAVEILAKGRDSKNNYHTLQKPALLVLNYYDFDSDGYIDNVSENVNLNQAKKLGIYRYDGITWIPVGGDVDITAQTVTARINTFSCYALALVDAFNGEKIVWGRVVSPSVITPNGDGINDFALFSFYYQENSKVSLKIYDAWGNVIADLTKKLVKNGGFYSVSWDGTTDSGIKVARGIYFYILKAGNLKKIGAVKVVR